MAMRELTLPGCDVKKANQLVRSKISISDALGSRILASLIACIRKDDTKFRDVYSLPVKDFITDKGGKSYTEIKAVCRELVSSYAELETKAPDGEPHLTLMPFFEKIEYHKGIVKARFNQGMSDLLLALQGQFTKYNLIEYLKLPSVYSQRLFEILKSWSDKEEKEYSVAELHKMLATPESFQTNFYEFRRWVLEKAHKDITKKTSLRYDWEPIKKGRSVIAVRFIFHKRKIALPPLAAKTEMDASVKRVVNCLANKCGKCTTPMRTEECEICRQQHPGAVSMPL